MENLPKFDNAGASLPGERSCLLPIHRYNAFGFLPDARGSQELKPVTTFLRRLALAGLLALPALPAWALSQGDRQLYQNAFQAAHNGDWTVAWRDAGKAHDPLLAKVLRWLDLSHGASGARFGEIVDFINANPDWPGQLALRQRAEEALASSTPPGLAQWFLRFPPVTAVGKLRQAEIWLAAGHVDEANERIREVWIKGDLGVFDEKSLLQRFPGVLRHVDDVQRLDRLLWDGQVEASRRMMAQLGGDYRLLGEARLRLAEMEPGADRWVAKVPAAMQNDPGLLFERMRWRARRDRYEEAIAILDHPPQDLVRPAAWAAERQGLVRHALAGGDISVAYRLASQHGLTTGSAFTELEFLAGWVALRFLREPETAYNHFVRLYDDAKAPSSAARGAYWAARAAEAMRFHQLSVAWYATAAEQVTTYYGQLAATAVGEVSVARVVAEPKPSPADIVTFDKLELVQVAQLLGEIGANDQMRPFLLRLSELSKSPAEHVLVARLAAKLERPDLAVAVAKRASYAGVSLVAEGYPLTELPPGGNAEQPLVLAMARQESAFDRQAVSSAGARGLMQLMPATARHVAKVLRLPFSASRLTADGPYNITLGRSYLDGLLDDFSGSYVLAIAGYNAGPGRVRQWIREFGDPRRKGVDMVDWIESIPVNETRNYVQRVLENLQVYRLRLGDHGLAFSLASDLKR
jgi:soluble lytic murein transglycosylase